MMTRNIEVTTEDVVTLPTPSAPPFACMPKYDAVMTINQANTTLFPIPVIISAKLTAVDASLKKAATDISRVNTPTIIPPAVPIITDNRVKRGRVREIAHILGCR
jgi:hypothetical protein